MWPEGTPNPGSDEAVANGCICAVGDNGRGNEALGKARGFYITGGCLLHDSRTFAKQAAGEDPNAIHVMPENSKEYFNGFSV